MKIKIILKKKKKKETSRGGDLRAPLCGHNVRALYVISLTSQDKRGRVCTFSGVGRKGGPLKLPPPPKQGRGRKSESKIFCPSAFFQMKSKRSKTQ